jgi:hypothetical protein
MTRVAAVLVAGCVTVAGASCADVRVRGEDSDAIWNFTPAQPFDSVSPKGRDPALAVCCPREGGLVIALEGDDVDGATRSENESAMHDCEEGRKRFGGSCFMPPSIPDATVRCVERMVSAWSVGPTSMTTPAYLELSCRANPAR